ncbi:hypothetical protein GGU10DRAFT_341791 [Lentinula aff. detonsa]|uniref:Uncharacterized protein n=1 Tax=Lentinula aff. detonsa TaxID=2804958 RepID=A0AA38U6B1_9AGAR|nr:hypothetical protein GGU10DRAFT_341791 [Lentinula aff. detonsa]
MSVRLIPCAYNLLCFLTTHLYWTSNAFDHFSLLPFSSIPCICIYFDNSRLLCFRYDVDHITICNDTNYKPIFNYQPLYIYNHDIYSFHVPVFLCSQEPPC